MDGDRNGMREWNVTFKRREQEGKCRDDHREGRRGSGRLRDHPK